MRKRKTNIPGYRVPKNPRIERVKRALGSMKLEGVPESKLKKELAKLLNRFAVDAALYSPDFILADYLLRCLKAHANCNKATTDFFNDAPF